MANAKPNTVSTPALPEVRIGDTYGDWTVISGPIYKFNRIKHWEVRCTCGAVKEIKQHSLLTGRSRSCGQHKEVSTQTKQLLAARRALQGAPFPKGSIHTPETRAKMSAAHKARHAARKSA